MACEINVRYLSFKTEMSLKEKLLRIVRGRPPGYWHSAKERPRSRSRSPPPSPITLEQRQRFEGNRERAIERIVRDAASTCSAATTVELTKLLLSGSKHTVAEIAQAGAIVLAQGISKAVWNLEVVEESPLSVKSPEITSLVNVSKHHLALAKAALAKINDLFQLANTQRRRITEYEEDTLVDLTSEAATHTTLAAKNATAAAVATQITRKPLQKTPPRTSPQEVAVRLHDISVVEPAVTGNIASPVDYAALYALCIKEVEDSKRKLDEMAQNLAREKDTEEKWTTSLKASEEQLRAQTSSGNDARKKYEQDLEVARHDSEAAITSQKALEERLRACEAKGISSDEMRKEVDGVRAELSAARQKADETAAQKTLIEQNLAKSNERVQICEAARSTSDGVRKKLEQDLAGAIERAAALEKDLEVARRDLEIADMGQKKLEERLRAQTTSSDVVMGEVKAELTRAQEVVKEAVEQKSVMAAKLVEADAKVRELGGKLLAVQDELAEVVNQSEFYQKTISGLRKEADELHQKKIDLEMKLKEARAWVESQGKKRTYDYYGTSSTRINSYGVWV